MTAIWIALIFVILMAILWVERRFEGELIERLVEHHREFLDGLGIVIPPDLAKDKVVLAIAMNGWFLTFINPRSGERRPLKLLLRNRKLLATTGDPRVGRLCALRVTMRRVRIVYLASVPLLSVILLGFVLY